MDNIERIKEEIKKNKWIELPKDLSTEEKREFILKSQFKDKKKPSH